MELHFAHFVTLGLFLTFLLLLYGFYSNYKKKIEGFPFSHIIPYLIYSQITGKINKDTPLNNGDSTVNMDLYFAHFATLGHFLTLLLLLYGFYSNYKKKIEGFPFSLIIPYLIYSEVTGKINKDTLLNNVFFQKLLEFGNKYAEEGLFMTFFSRPLLYIFSADAIKVFANEKTAIDKSPEYKVVRDRMGDGISTSNGKRWRLHKKLIIPAFHMGVLKAKVPLFNEHAMALVKDMEKMVGKPSVDVLGVLKCHYFSALSESVFGLKQSEENKAQILRFGDIIDSISVMTAQRIFCPWLRPKVLLQLFPFGRKHCQELQESDLFITNVIYKMKKHVTSKETMNTELFGPHMQKSFTYILLNQHLNDPTFTFEDVHNEVKTIAITGYDTVTYTTMWCLYLLGLHPEVQEKVYSEIQSTTSDYVTYEESSNLSYLESVIMESLRLYPTVPMFSRNLTKDVQCGKYKVLKDTTVVFFPYLSHRDSKAFPDPEKFKPERFSGEETKRSWSLIPFAEGNRSCIGKNYGLIEMKIFLTHILRNFKITSLDRREDINLCWTIVLSPAKPLRMKITLRCDTCK